MDTKDCKHENLHSGSGGFYIFCDKCHCVWVAKKSGHVPDTDIDYSRNNLPSTNWKKTEIK